MKTLIAIFLLVPCSLFAQSKSIGYVPYIPGIGGPGIATHGSNIKFPTDAQVDSAWGALSTYGTISGVPVRSASLFVGFYEQSKWVDPLGDRTGIFRLIPASSSGNVLQDNGTWGLPYIAGSNITISGNTISASGGGGGASLQNDTVTTSTLLAASTEAFRLTAISGAGSLHDTITAPTSGMQGYRWCLATTTAHIDTIECATGFNFKGSTGYVITGGTAGDCILLTACNGAWITTPNNETVQ